MFSFIGGLLKAFNAIFSLFTKKDDQATGAALQRGKNSEDELARVTNATDEKNKANSAIANDAERDRLLSTDKNNRDNKR